MFPEGNSLAYPFNHRASMPEAAVTSPARKEPESNISENFSNMSLSPPRKRVRLQPGAELRFSPPSSKYPLPPPPPSSPAPSQDKTFAAFDESIIVNFVPDPTSESPRKRKVAAAAHRRNLMAEEITEVRLHDDLRQVREQPILPDVVIQSLKESSSNALAASSSSRALVLYHPTKSILERIIESNGRNGVGHRNEREEEDEEPDKEDIMDVEML